MHCNFHYIFKKWFYTEYFSLFLKDTLPNIQAFLNQKIFERFWQFPCEERHNTVTFQLSVFTHRMKKVHPTQSSSGTFYFILGQTLKSQMPNLLVHGGPSPERVSCFTVCVTYISEKSDHKATVSYLTFCSHRIRTEKGSSE